MIKKKKNQIIFIITYAVQKLITMMQNLRHYVTDIFYLISEYHWTTCRQLQLIESAPILSFGEYH